MRTSLSPGSAPTARRWLLAVAVALPLVVPALVAPPAGADHAAPHVAGTVTVTLTREQNTATATLDQTEVATWRVDGPAVDILGIGKLEPVAAELDYSYRAYSTNRLFVPGVYDCTSERLYEYGPATWTGPDLSGFYARPLLRVDLNDDFHPGRARVEVLYGTVGPIEGTWWDRRPTPTAPFDGTYTCAETVTPVSLIAAAVPFRILEDLDPATHNDLNTVFHLAGTVTQNPSPGVTFTTVYDLTVTLPDHDTDGDGFTDAEENAAGTDPNDPNDYPGSPPEEEPGPCEGEGVERDTADPAFRQRLVIPAFPDLDIGTFDTLFAYCWDGRSADITTADATGTENTDVIAATLFELVGFTVKYNAEKFFVGEPVYGPLATSRTVAGEMDAVVNPTRFLVVTGVEKRLTDVLGRQLAKRIGPLLVNGKLQPGQLTALVDDLAKKVRSKATEISEKLTDLGVRKSLAQFAEDLVVDKIDDVLDRVVQGVALAEQSYLDLTPEEIAEEVYEAASSLLDEALSIPIPLWQPEVTLTVTHSGQTQVTLTERYRHPFTAISQIS